MSTLFPAAVPAHVAAPVPALPQSNSTGWIYRAVLLLLLLLAGASTRAQDPGSGGPQPGTPDPTAVPIDGGASLLLAGGAAYALRRLRRRPA